MRRRPQWQRIPWIIYQPSVEEMYLHVNQWLVHFKCSLHRASTFIWRNEPCSPFPKVDFIQPVWSHGTDIDAVNILYPSKKKLDLIHMELCKRGPSLTAKFSFPSAVHRGSFGIDIMCFGKANKLACDSMTCIMKPLGLKKKKRQKASWCQGDVSEVGQSCSLCGFKSLNHWQDVREQCIMGKLPSYAWPGPLGLRPPFGCVRRGGPCQSGVLCLSLPLSPGNKLCAVLKCG